MTPRTATASTRRTSSSPAAPPVKAAAAVPGQGDLTPLQRIETLCDPGSLRLMRTAVLSPTLGDRATPGDGVLAGVGTVGGRSVAVFCFSAPSLAR